MSRPDATPGAAPECPRCGTPMVLANTMRFRFGQGWSRRYWNCPRYPACRTARAAQPDVAAPPGRADHAPRR